MPEELEIFLRETPPADLALRHCLACGEPNEYCECRPSSGDYETEENEDDQPF